MGTRCAKAVQVGGIPLDVEPIYSNKQTDTKLGYFDMDLKSGDQTTLTLALKSSSDKAQTVVIQPIIGTTLASGQLSYQPSKFSQDSSLGLKFNKMVSKKKTIRLKAKEQRNVVFTLKVPAESTFNGIVLGSLYLYSPTANQKAKKNRSTKRMRIVNLYSMYMGTTLRINNSTEVKPNFRILRVTPAISNGEAAVMAQLQNFKPAMITNGGLLLQAKVYPRNSSEVVMKEELPAASFAPNSTMHLPLLPSKGKLQAGNYTLKMHLEYQDQSWNLKRNFTITGSQISKMDDALQPKKSYLWLWILLGVLAALLIIIFIFFMYRHGKNKALQSVQQAQSGRRRKRK